MANKYPVSFKLTSEEKFSENIADKKPAYHDGQIIFVETTGKLYLDFHGERVCYSGSGSSESTSSFRYLGISEINPDEGIPKVNDIEYPAEPKNRNKVVVFGSKEFVCRQDKDENWGWFELGDENIQPMELAWEIDV